MEQVARKIHSGPGMTEEGGRWFSRSGCLGKSRMEEGVPDKQTWGLGDLTPVMGKSLEEGS